MAYIETGKIDIDKPDNALRYGDDAVIINVSAFSIKNLYATHNNALLSRNLRYFVKKRDIDTAIQTTIKETPDSFWFKNNGITIICDDFEISSKVIKLKNFSIINGGQTTRLLHKDPSINESHTFYLPCKIIKTSGETDDDKQNFILEIAKATNSQKAIKAIDLKSNSPEQIRFKNKMKSAGIYYQTKRGENIPKDYKDDFLHTDLASVGKLCLAGIFQRPATSRNKPSSLYDPMFYNVIFDTNQKQICSISKDLLYMDYFFRKVFTKSFDKKYEDDKINDGILPFAHNARTICLSFVVLISRYLQKNIDDDKMKDIFDLSKKQDGYKNYLYDIFKDVENVQTIFEKHIESEKVDAFLNKLFTIIIDCGYQYFKILKENDASIVESNFFKKDENYYKILSSNWNMIKKDIGGIQEIFQA